jgi:hypothetical protein
MLATAALAVHVRPVRHAEPVKAATASAVVKIRRVRNPTPLIRLKQPSNFPPFRQGIIRKEIIWRAKGQLAFDILTEAFADSIRPDFVCGDKIYGLRTELREYPKTKTRVPERPRSVLLPGESSRCC